MEVIKKINNNVAIALDDRKREVVLFGKGIGFPSMPYELNDPDRIERTYYDIDPRYYAMISEVDSTVWKLTSKMVDIITEKIDGQWNPNLVFILVDHLNFAVERYRKNLSVQFPYSEDLEVQFPRIHKYAAWVIRNINHHMQVKLPKGEITCVAMHLINARQGIQKTEAETLTQKTARIQKMLTRIIEDYFQISVDHKDINYIRFRQHIKYFIQRIEDREEFLDDNGILFDNMKTAFPDTYACVLLLNEALEKEYGSPCSSNELLYLMIHINRLYQRGLL